MNQKTRYLTRSKLGIWYYQRWMPLRIRKSSYCPFSVFKISLRTSCNLTATYMANRLTMEVDQILLQHFQDPETFARAMKLYHKYASNHLSLEDYEYLGLDSDDERILNTVLALTKPGNRKDPIVRNYGKRRVSTATTYAPLPRTYSLSLNTPNTEDPTVSALVDKWKINVQPTLQKQTFESNSTSVDLFLKFVTHSHQGDIAVSQLTPTMMNNYGDFYQKIPKSVSLRDKTIPSIQRLLTATRTKSSKTVNDHYSQVGSFLRWVQNKGYAINPSLIAVLTKGNKVVAKGDSQVRLPFSDNDLTKLFNSEQYTKTGKLKTASMYWVPLIAVFTGARMGEILQLETHDIKRDGANTYISIDDTNPASTDPDKRLKQTGSKRVIPAHSQLMALGFTQFVEWILDKGETRLFFDEPRNKVGKFDAFSKRFATYRKSCNVEPSTAKEKKDFHSFRHTVRTRLADIRTTGTPSQQFDEGIIDAIVGHESSSRSVGEKTYNHTQYLSAKKKALERLAYPSINFDLIMAWKKTSFHRRPRR